MNKGTFVTGLFLLALIATACGPAPAPTSKPELTSYQVVWSQEEFAVRYWVAKAYDEFPDEFPDARIQLFESGEPLVVLDSSEVVSGTAAVWFGNDTGTLVVSDDGSGVVVDASDGFRLLTDADCLRKAMLTMVAGDSQEVYGPSTEPGKPFNGAVQVSIDVDLAEVKLVAQRYGTNVSEDQRFVTISKGEIPIPGGEPTKLFNLDYSGDRIDVSICNAGGIFGLTYDYGQNFSVP